MENRLNRYRWIWHSAFFCFLLAAITGVFYRFGLLGRLPFDFSLQHIRHAHSHLMFFGWAVPVPLYALLLRVSSDHPANQSALRLMKGSLAGIFIFGLLSYPFFLMYGYLPVPIGNSSLPFSVIFSGLVMVGWYGFLWGYYLVRTQVKQHVSAVWLETALVMLFISSLGAWGVAVLQAAAPGNRLLAEAMTHFFLSSFTEGWVVLVILGLLIRQFRIKMYEFPLSPQLLAGFVAVGAPLTFPYGISEQLLTSGMLLAARFGGLLVSAGIVLSLVPLFRNGRKLGPLWRWPVIFILLKVLMQTAGSIIPTTFWFSDPILRVFYLHVLLLGAMTTGFIAWIHQMAEANNRYFSLVLISIVIVLLSLAMMTQLWPAEWGGTWLFYLAACAALLPPGTVAVEWYMIYSSTGKNTREAPERVESTVKTSGK